MITHDRYFLDNVVSWILELDRGKYFPYEGNYSTYLEKKSKRMEQEEREESGRQKAIKDELEWIRQGAKARQTKSKARIAKFDQLVAAQEKHVPGKAEILIQVPERLGGKVIEVNGHDQSTRAYVGAFNFKGQDQQKNVGKLSGGERNRVNIAKMLKKGGNVLLLDEPTNDLDVETLGALEEAIENFAGCAVVISHDRFFLDRLATHILAFEGDGEVTWFEGNFESYEEDKVRRLGEEATRPHRMTYRKLTR